MASQSLTSDSAQPNTPRSPLGSIRHLLGALYQHPSPDACVGLTDQLHEYVIALVNWNSNLVQFAELAQHLDGCVACSEAFSRLYELQLQIKQNSLPTPVSIPAPDLSFLQQTQDASRIDRLRAAVTRVGKQVSLQLSGDLLPLFRPALAVSTLRSAQRAQYSETLIRLETPTWIGSQWPAVITAYRNQRRPDHCLVEVTVALPDRFWPELAGSTVSIAINEQIRSRITDAWGIASFEDVLIADLASLRLSLEGEEG